MHDMVTQFVYTVSRKLLNLNTTAITTIFGIIEQLNRNIYSKRIFICVFHVRYYTSFTMIRNRVTEKRSTNLVQRRNWSTNIL
jgi:hypothetical protein